MHPIKHIFISYSHKDNDIYIKLLRKQLSVLERNRSVRIWTDQDIRAGENWETKIHEAIEMADLSILMISANFFESEYIQEDELPAILEREKNTQLTLFPIILEPCSWHLASWLSEKQARPQNGKMICDADDQTQKKLFSEITNEINDILFSDTTNSTKSKPVIQTESQDAHCGAIVHLMCDRTDQVNAFRKSFLSQGNENPKKPQFYVIHGKERNGHLSLVKRLNFQIVYPFANKQLPDSKKRLPDILKPGWPEKDDKQDDVKIKMERLQETLFQAIFHQESFYYDDNFPAQYTLKDLIQSNPINACADHAVLIAHRIPAVHWDLDLANQYISDFLSCAEKLSNADEMPLMIVFFNIEYPNENPRSFKKKRSFFFRKKIDPRAKTTEIRYWGNSPDQACDYANVADQTAKTIFKNWDTHQCTDEFIYTAPVKSFLPNLFGLHDMLGNVWEWCADDFAEDAYSNHERNNPIYDEAGASFRVLRGGSWNGYPRSVRSAVRFWIEPSYCYSVVGARLLRK